MSLRAKAEAHAAVCREAMAAGHERPRWEGGCLKGAYLSGANLSGADLRGANLFGTNLTRVNLAFARLCGADLRGARFYDTDLTGADLAGADLREADLRWTTLVGADLTGARLSEGVARGRAIGGHVGGYHWWAAGLEDGGAILQYGCECHPLAWWLDQGPELSQRHGHPASHWAEGPAVAIAAAVELSQALPPVSVGEPAARLGGISLRGAQTRK